jgi:hypothetical protein
VVGDGQYRGSVEEHSGPDAPTGDGAGADDAAQVPDAPDVDDGYAGDAYAAAPDEDVLHDPLRFHQWMKRSATGAVMTGVALGLQQALERRREVPAFVMEAPGEPDDPDAPIHLHFDPDDPTKTVAVIRAAAPPPPAASDN